MINLAEHEVDLRTYWPDFLREYLELQTLASVEAEAINAQRKTLEQIHKASFIYHADELGLKRYEEMLNILVPAGATLDDRRLVIITKLSTRRPYTRRVLRQFLAVLVGADGYTMVIDYGKRALSIRIELSRQAQLEAVRSLLRKVLPANMLYEVDLRYNQVYMLKKFTVAELKAYTAHRLRIDASIKEIFISRGGVLQ